MVAALRGAVLWRASGSPRSRHPGSTAAHSDTAAFRAVFAGLSAFSFCFSQIISIQLVAAVAEEKAEAVVCWLYLLLEVEGDTGVTMSVSGHMIVVPGQVWVPL